MKILVTGGCGFIGSAFCRRIKQTYPDYTLINIDYLYPCSTNATDLTISHDNYRFVHGDIKDTDLLQQIFEEVAIDTVVHFAAQSHVDTSFTNPLLYTQDNVQGTHSLLEACRKHGHVKRFIHISTDEVYGENAADEHTAKTETSLLKPTNPYAASKAGAEMLVHAYGHSYGLPTVVIRSNNIYGPGQYPEKVVPRFILQLLNTLPITIQGTGDQLRSFLYVEDAVDAVLCIMEHGAIGSIYNISSQAEISIMELARLLVARICPDTSLENCINYIPDRNFNDKRYWIRSDPLAELGWSQKTTLADGLTQTINWYKEHRDTKYWVAPAPLLTAHATTPPPSVLFFGARGWIGGQFTKILRNRGWHVHEAPMRAGDRRAIEAAIISLHPRPTHIVSMIGRTHGPGFTTIDYLEQPGKLTENMNDNLYGPLVLAEIARKFDLHYTYLGTGCIFEYDDVHRLAEGEAGVGFTEADAPNFFGSAYSTVKGYTDRLLAEAPHTLNVRIRMPISSQDGPRNFITKIINYPRICSIPNSMTVLDDILPLLADAMQHRVTGTLNATNPGLIDHTTILQWYRELQCPSHSWQEVTPEELTATLVAGRRSNNLLDTTRICKLFPGGVPHIRDSVRRILEQNAFAPRP